MAYSYLKLPPITGESSLDTEEEEDLKSANGLVRDKHGLVRLPPIVRLDSLRSRPSSVQRFPHREERITDQRHDRSTHGSSLNISHKLDIFRHGNSRKRLSDVENYDENMKLLAAQNERSVFDSERRMESEKKTGLFPTREGSKGLPCNEDAMPVNRKSLANQKDNTALQNTQKLSTSRRLARSSPELFHRRINLEQGAGAKLIADTKSSALASPDLHPERISKSRLSVHDFDGSLLSRSQNTMKNDDKPKREKRGYRSLKGNLIRQPLSSPNSPVCSESANRADHKHKSGRKSLNDISDTVKHFIDRGGSSMSPPRKQNLMADVAGLKIEGKNFSPEERNSAETTTVLGTDSLKKRLQDEKRPSVYDLQQILSLLQREDFKQLANPNSSSALTKESENTKSSLSSVYDLREFLITAAKAEAGNGQQPTKTTKNTLGVGTQSANLLSPHQDREKDHHGVRKSSMYDLIEFLSLGSTKNPGSASTSKNTSRSSSPTEFTSKRPTDGEPDLLSVSPEKSSEEMRRRSTYDLMEFLSLPRSRVNSRSESRQSSASSQSDTSVTSNSSQKDTQGDGGRHVPKKRSLSVYDLVEFLSMTSDVPPLVRVTPSHEDTTAPSDRGRSDLRSNDGNSRETRSLSMYDLAEFLTLSSGVPPLVRVTTSAEGEEQSTGCSTAAMFEIKGEKGDISKKDSLYDLREILNVMQQEQEKNVTTIHGPDRDKNTVASPLPAQSATGERIDCSLLPASEGSKSSNSAPAARQMSVHDFREFIALYASHQGSNSSNQHTQPWSSRKISSASQSGISIHVTDEGNKSLDIDADDVFLPLPEGDASNTASAAQRKRSSVYDLREFLNILNGDDSPLRRRLSSMSTVSSKSTDNASELNNTSSLTDSHGLSLSATDDTSVHSRPLLSPRQDSGGNVSLYDLGEFLSLLDKDESPLRRRLSSIGNTGSKSESENSKPQVYNLQDILTAFNDFEQKKVNGELSSDFTETGGSDEVRIHVPNLLPRSERESEVQHLQPEKQTSIEKSRTNISQEGSAAKTTLSC